MGPSCRSLGKTTWTCLCFPTSHHSSVQCTWLTHSQSHRNFFCQGPERLVTKSPDHNLFLLFKHCLTPLTTFLPQRLTPLLGQNFWFLLPLLSLLHSPPPAMGSSSSSHSLNVWIFGVLFPSLLMYSLSLGDTVHLIKLSVLIILVSPVSCALELCWPHDSPTEILKSGWPERTILCYSLSEGCTNHLEAMGPNSTFTKFCILHVLNSSEIHSFPFTLEQVRVPCALIIPGAWFPFFLTPVLIFPCLCFLIYAMRFTRVPILYGYGGDSWRNTLKGLRSIPGTWKCWMNVSQFY